MLVDKKQPGTEQVRAGGARALCRRAPPMAGRKDAKLLKIAHFRKFLEIKNIYDLDKIFYGNSHSDNVFQASRYLRFGLENYFQFLVCGDRRVRVVNLYKI